MRRSEGKAPARRGRRAAVALAAVAGAALALAPASHAGRIYPLPILDANTGQDSIQLGAAIGNRHAWAAFAQETAGTMRLYIRYARNGKLRRVVQFADQGNAITGGGLIGDTKGRAMLIWGEQIAGQGVVFSRRLNDGLIGPVIRVTPVGSDVDFSNLMNPFDRGRDMAMSRGGGAAFCYRDANNDDFVATIKASGASWVHNLLPRPCGDLGIDDRGNVVSLSSDVKDLFADKLIRGQVISERITDDFMDQGSLAVGFGGTALAVYRPDTKHIFAYRKRDIAQGGPWEKVGGNVEQGLLIPDGRSPEDPFAAMNARGDGIVIFRDNGNTMNDVIPHGYYRLLDGGSPTAGGILNRLNSSRARVAVDRLGRPVVAHTNIISLDANKNPDQFRAFVRVFSGGQPGPERPLAPGIPDTGSPNILGLAVDGRRNFLALVNEFSSTRVRGAFGDFSLPNVRPRAFPRRPRAGQRVRLASRPFDSFKPTTPGDVLWRVPRGVRIVRAFKRAGRRARGRKIRVRFRRAGRYRIRVKIGDGAGNSRTKFLRIRVRRAR